MIGLVAAQLAARWGQALTLLVLSVAATLAASSVPTYAAAVDRAAVANELAADAGEGRVLSLPLAQREWDQPPEELPGQAAALAELTAFTPVTTVEIRVQGLPGQVSTVETHRLVARDGFCAYVTFQAGRCPVGSREAALPAALAAQTGLRPGDELALTPVRRTERGPERDGPQVTIAVMGVFEATDPTDPYWLLQDPLGGSTGEAPAVFTNRTALQTLAHGQEFVHVSAVLPESQLTLARIPQLRDQLEVAEEQLGAGGVGGRITTGLSGLLDRITATGDQARELLPTAAAPLVALSWFVVYLAVGHGVAGRRHEVGVVTLRGPRPATRVVAVAAESLLPVLAGVAAGLALTGPLVALAGPGPGGGATGVGEDQLLAGGLAVVGIVVAVLVALRRELAAPVVQLLRRVPPRRRRGAVAAVEALPVVLAIAAVADLRAGGGELVGVMVVAPAVVMLAVAVLAARAVRPLIDRAGRWSLRRGRLGPAMAALYLARRPGAARLLLVLALAFGMLGFAATSADVAAQGRAALAEQRLGATRVLELQQTSRGELLEAVRAADPSGRYAMAVASVPGGSDSPPAIAVDATRLGVSLWPDGSLDPAQVAELLRPAAPETGGGGGRAWTTAQVGDGELTAELSAELTMERDAPDTAPDRLLVVSLLLAPATSAEPAVAVFPPIEAGRSTYRTEVTGCEDTCRVAGVAVTLAEPPPGAAEVARFDVTLSGLRQAGQDVAPPDWLTDEGRWRNPERGLPAYHLLAEASPDGLRLVHQRPRPDTSYSLLTIDASYPLPVVTTGAPPADEVLPGVDGEPVQAAAQASLPGLPGLGGSGVLMDLESADRLTAEPGVARSPQVWLAADAPDRVVDRLEDEGLVVTGERTVEELRASLDESGAALALRFHLLTAGLAVLVGLGALALVTAVDRRTWSRGLRDLRAQGLAERTTTAAALWSYGGVVLAGAVAGALAAGAAWLAAGDRLPLGVADQVAEWPQWMQVLAPWTAAVAVLLAAAAAGAWWQRESVRGREV